MLADALVLATEDDPDLIVDVATLTGAMVMALGNKVCGVVGSEDVVAQVIAAGTRAGEAHWAMPIPEEMSERIRSSKIADLAQHDWVRWGGGLYAAAFLREFTAGLPWAHLDIAGPSFNSGGPFGDWTSGGTGFAVATLVDLARDLATATDEAVDEPTDEAGDKKVDKTRLTSPAPQLLPRDVVAHPLGDPDDRGVVGRHPVVVAERVRPLHRRHPAARPLPVVGDQQQGHVADRGARFHEPLDAPALRHPLVEVAGVRAVRGRTVVEPVRAVSLPGRRTPGPRPRRRRSNIPMRPL